MHYEPGEQVVRVDHEPDSDVMTVERDNGGRYVDCTYNDSGVWVSHPRTKLGWANPTEGE